MSGYPPYDRPYARDDGDTDWSRSVPRPSDPTAPSGAPVPPSPPLARVGQAARVAEEEAARAGGATASQPPLDQGAGPYGQGTYGGYQGYGGYGEQGAGYGEAPGSHGGSPWRGGQPRRAPARAGSPSAAGRVPAEWIAVGCLLVLLVDTGVELLPEDSVVWVLTWQRLIVLLGLTAALVVTPRLSAFRTPLDGPLLLLLAVAAGASLVADAELAPWRGLLTAVGVFYLVVAVLRGVRGAALAVPLALAATGAAAAAVGLTQLSQDVDTTFYREGLLTNLDTRTPDSFVRATGTFTNPNLLAGFLVMTLPLAAVAAAAWRHRGGRILLLLAAGLGTAGLVATASRGGFVAALVVTLLALWLTLGLPRLGWAGWLLAAGAIALPVVAAVVVGPRSLIEATGRGDVWGSSLTAVLDRPLLGAGYGRAGEVLTEINGAPIAHAHNIVLHWWVEAGVAGMAAVVLVLAVAAVAAVRRARAGSATAAAGLLGLGGLLGVSLFDHPTVVTRVLVAAMAVLALAVAARVPRAGGGLEDGLADEADQAEQAYEVDEVEDLASAVTDPEASGPGPALPGRGRHVGGAPGEPG